MLAFTYGLLIGVIIGRISIHCYLLALHNSLVPTYEKIVVIGDTCISAAWLVYSIDLCITKWNLNYLENPDRASMLYIIFCMQYYLLCTWSVNALYTTFWTNFGIALVVLFFAYGFLSEKSPNIQAIVSYLLFVVLTFELIIRAILCKCSNPCGTPERMTFQKELSIYLYDKTQFDQKSCSICLHDFADKEKVCPLPCHKTHVFHIECLSEWITRNSCCPYCRTPVT